MNKYNVTSTLNKDELFTNLLINDGYIDKIYGFSYKRTFSRDEGDELTQEIILQLLISFRKNHHIENINAYIWKIAYNVYGKWVARRKKLEEKNGEEFQSLNVSEKSFEEDLLSKMLNKERYESIIREISFLSKIYRDVMIMFYLEEKSIAEIASALCIPENRVKQRLFSAKEKVRKGVSKVEKSTVLNLKKMWSVGNGDFSYGDMRKSFERILSQNILVLCKNKSKSSEELSRELNVPTIFIEDEVQNLTSSGALKKIGKEKYITNFIVIDGETYKIANNLVKEYSDCMTEKIIKYIKDNRDKINDIKFISNPKSFEFILWCMLPRFADCYDSVITKEVLSYFENEGIEQEERMNHILGIFWDINEEFGEDAGYFYGLNGNNVFGSDEYKEVSIIQLNGRRLHCDFYNKLEERFLVKCIKGIDIKDLSEKEKEVAAKLIYRKILRKEGDFIYPSVPVFNKEEYLKFEKIIYNFEDEIKDDLKEVSKKYIEIIKEYVPKHLLNQVSIFVSSTANSTRNEVIERCIEKGVLYIPDEDICSEGIWVVVEEKDK